jgi:aldehyde dehydrogenase (NAD+)
VAATDGAVLAGGRRIEHSGNYLEPTVVEVGADSDSPLVREEVFAPVVALQSAPSADAAVEMANDTDYGLVAAVFTRDLGSALSALARLEAGLIRVNAPTVGVDFHVPFGGNKRSSLGPREQGEAARDFFTETSTVVVRP